MGPEFWKPQSPTRLRKCDEFRVGSCNEPTDGCCAVVSCRYCLTFEGTYSYTGTATFSDNGWQGTIAGSTFFAYWERNAYTGECEFIVTIDGYEVYRKSCYEGQSCRDSSDSVYVTIGDESGVLAWSRHTLRPLEYVIDSDTGCRTWFCGTCECVCACLCVTVTEFEGTTTRGEICDTSYPCDAPLWIGVVGGFDLEISLGRDSYGNCVLTGMSNYETLEEIPVGGCTAIDVTFTLYDGTTIHVFCKVCDCEPDTACIGCCFPLDDYGDLAEIPFEVGAPSCPEVDGLSGVFTHDAIEPQNKVCGSCGSFSWTKPGPQFLMEIPSVFYNPDGMGGCDAIPGDGLAIRFALYCDGEFNLGDAPGLPDCCRRLRLVCGTSYETVYADPEFVLPDLGNYITIIEPDSCTCDLLSAIFSLCRLVPKPQPNPAPECPFAPGFEVPRCDLCDMELVI